MKNVLEKFDNFFHIHEDRDYELDITDRFYVFNNNYLGLNFFLKNLNKNEALELLKEVNTRKHFDYDYRYFNNSNNLYDEYKTLGLLKYLSNDLKKDRDIALESVKILGTDLKFASKKLQNDKDVVMEAVKQNSEAIKFASNTLKNDKNFIINIVKENPFFIKYLNNSLKNDKDVVMESVKQNGYILEYVPKKLKNDKDIVIEAARQSGFVLRWTSEEFKSDKNICKEIIKESLQPNCIEYVNKSIRNDVIYEVIKEDPSFMIHFTTYCDDLASFELTKKEKIVLKEFKNDLQEAIDNNSLDTFKQDYAKYFEDNSLEK